jgi:nickel transport protein
MLVIFVSASYTFAHRVVLFAYVEGDTVFTESYFSDGKRCQDSRIEVFDSFGNKLLEGTTDKNGEYSFIPPKKTDL